MVLDMRVIGRMIYSMDTVKKYGQITQNTKVNIVRVVNTEEELINGQMEVNTKAIGSKTE